MKFNYIFKRKEKIQNYEGAVAYTLSPEQELYTAVVTTGLNNSFYEKGSKRLERIQSLIKNCNPEFVAKLACYARSEMHLRSVPLVLSVELAKQEAGTSLVSKAVNGVVQRADEITELLAYYQIANQRTGVKKLNRLSKQIQKGLAMAFNKFDEYQFAKYNAHAEIKLRDALFLTHPQAKDESQQAIFDKIVTDTLATPYTWETELSALGQQKFINTGERTAAFAQVWESLIESKKLGYMAMLRNLRNILEAGVSAKHIELVAQYIANEKAVLNSKQLPFRFLAAFRELQSVQSGYVRLIMEALEDAVSISASNVKGFDINTSVVIACDVSGSMQKAISARSKIMFYDIGLMLGMLLQSRCKNVISGMFGDFWKIVNMPGRSVLCNVNEYYRREGEVGYATNGYAVIDDLLRRKHVADKVMMFTDIQMWDNKNSGGCFEASWNEYKRFAPRAKLYLFDLAGYGQAPLDIRANDVYLIAGWSDKIFDVLQSLEDTNEALNKINSISL